MKQKEPKYTFQNVMLIDDSDLDNFINEKTLEANHFAKKIFVHTSGKSALEFLANMRRLATDMPGVFPSVIFIDLNMPLMDGFQFIEQFNKTILPEQPGVRLAVLTSSVYKEDREKATQVSP